MSEYRLHLGDCLEVMRGMAENSVHAIVADPPAGISFMGREWDKDKGGRRQWIAWMTDIAAECLRLLKPGGHALIWALPRTSHWTATAWEDAGFEIRDCCYHIFGSGFPKSMDVSKAIDKMAGAEREVIGNKVKLDSYGVVNKVYGGGPNHNGTMDITAPATDAAKQYSGFGTALKPSVEQWILFAKPLRIVPFDGIIMADTQHLIGGLLCQLLSNANSVDVISESSQQDSSADVSVSARLIAAVLRGSESADWCERMATFNSPATVRTCLNIAWLWNSILDAASNQASKFTTSTATEVTTALRILNSCLSEIIPDSIIKAVSRPSGSLFPAGIAASSLTASSAYTSNSTITIAAELASLRQLLIGLPANSAAQSLDSASQVAYSVLQNVTTTIGTNTASLVADEPSVECWWLLRKPLSEPTIAANVLKHGTGAINIDGCRVGTDEVKTDEPYLYKGNNGNSMGAASERLRTNGGGTTHTNGRWPANLLLSSDDAAALLDEMSGERRSAGMYPVHDGWEGKNEVYGKGMGKNQGQLYADRGGASRYFARFAPDADDEPLRMFYCAKSSRKDRDEGLEGMPEKPAAAMQGNLVDGQRLAGNGTPIATPMRRNGHPCVKPVSLMRWLVKLITSPGGTILDPFCGSGSTLKAAILEGFDCVGIEMSEEYLAIARARSEHALAQVQAQVDKQRQMSLLEPS